MKVLDFKRERERVLARNIYNSCSYHSGIHREFGSRPVSIRDGAHRELLSHSG